MIGYYLDVKVEVIEILEDGWCKAVFLEEKMVWPHYIMWLDQIKQEMWGEVSVA